MSWRIPGRVIATSFVWAWAATSDAQVLQSGASAPAPQAKSQALSAEAVVLQALASNPVTSPYVFGAGRKDGKLVLTGRVGTKQVHDSAVRVAMNVTPYIDDRIVIDTAEVYRAALNQSQNLYAGGRPSTAYGPMSGSYSYRGGGQPIYYPQPLFGRVDDPFFGFEPPPISYPPWWGIVAQRRGDPYAAPVLDPYSPIGPDPGPAPTNSSTPTPQPSPATATPSTSAKGDTIEMTLDPRGVAVLRGTVPTMNDRVAIGQKVAQMSGVREVVNLLNTRDNGDEPETSATRSKDVPPPPPVPAEQPNPGATPAPGASGEALQVRQTDDSIERRLAANLSRRASAEGSSVKSSVRDGVAYLSGKVPTALEAMSAFRTAQQTIGVREVSDRLEFSVPDGQKENPLITKGRPEDVEPYLEAQIRRQVGDRAHIDRVRVNGDHLTIHGTIVRDTDKPRVVAILRSMPLLRGFTIEATLVGE